MFLTGPATASEGTGRVDSYLAAKYPQYAGVTIMPASDDIFNMLGIPDSDGTFIYHKDKLFDKELKKLADSYLFTDTDYVLLLDSDNKIRSSFLDKGTPVLDGDPQIAVLYGDGQFFEKTLNWPRTETKEEIERQLRLIWEQFKPDRKYLVKKDFGKSVDW
jgi:hypothetical protein